MIVESTGVGVRRGLAAGVLFWGLLALLGATGPMVPERRELLASVALVMGGLARGAPSWRTLWCLAGAAALPVVPPGLVQAAAYCGAVGLAMGGELTALTTGLWVASLGVFVVNAVPEATAAASWLATGIAGLRPGAPEGLEYGPSAAGLPALICAGACLAAAGGRSLWPLLAAAFALTVFQEPIGAWLHRGAGPFAHHLHPFPLFGGLAPLAVASAALVGARYMAVGPRPPRGGRGAAVGAAVAGGVLAASMATGGVLPGEGVRTVAFINEGGLDWETPGAEDVGTFSGGMFGLLPHMLEGAGWRAEACSLDDFLAGETKAQVAVLINAPHLWTEAQRGAMDRHLEGGGSLLVLGDHTDVYGLMGGFNSLLGPMGIRFLFDSGRFQGVGWHDDLATGEFGAGLAPDPRDASVGTGASLDLRSPAHATLRAPYGFSDIGIRENRPGAFLGNYEYEVGERLGDIVLNAAVRRGAGRVLVYGDTTPFQNSVLPTSFVPHVWPVFEELSRRPGAHLPGFMVRGLGVLCAGLLGLLALLGRGRGVLAGALAVALVAATHGVVRGHGDGLARAATLERLADEAMMLDLSHAPDIGDRGSKWNEVHPLLSAAARTRIVPLRVRRWESASVRRARAIALVAPRIPLSASDVADLEAALENGGAVLAMASAGGGRGLAPLLERHGVAIQGIHIGPVPEPTLQRPSQPRFVDPSPLVFEPRPGDEVLYAAGEIVLALARPVGSGWLVIVADGRFASSQNVEGMWGEWPGNVRFLLDLCLRFCGGSLEGFPEAFPAPPAPPE